MCLKLQQVGGIVPWFDSQTTVLLLNVSTYVMPNQVQFVVVRDG